MQEKIPYRVSEADFKRLAYKDRVYAWLLAHAYCSQNEYHSYIYKDSFTYTQIGKDIHRSSKTISRHIQKLINDGYLYEQTVLGKNVFIIPYSSPFEYIDGETVIALIRMIPNEKTGSMEDLINVLAYVLSKKHKANQEGKSSFEISAKELIKAFGHSVGHEETYQLMRCNLTILQGAGIIKFKTINYRDREGMPQEMFIYWVSDKGKASDEWLGIQAQSQVENKDE